MVNKLLLFFVLSDFCFQLLQYNLKGKKAQLLLVLFSVNLHVIFLFLTHINTDMDLL